MSENTTEEDLRTLGDLVPLLAKKVADAHEAAEALEAAATELQHEVDDARHEAASRLAALQDALPALVVQVETEEKQLKDADTELLDAWHEAAPHLAQSGDAMVKQAHDVGTHAHDLRAALAEAGTKIDQSQREGDAALAQLAQDAQAAEKRIEDALHALEAEVEHFKQSAQAAHDALTEAARELLAVLTESTGHADTALQQSMDDMSTRMGAHKDAAHELYQALAGDVMSKVDAAGEELDQAVMTPLGEAEAHLREDLVRLATLAATQEKELEQHAQALEHALEEVKGETGVVPAGVAEINEAARRLGI